jgi:hypothetical protein
MHGYTTKVMNAQKLVSVRVRRAIAKVSKEGAT